MTSLGRRLRTARVAAGKTQREIASKIGVSAVTVSKWERGEIGLAGARLEQVANLIGAEQHWLVTGVESRGQDPGAANSGVRIPRLSQEQILPFRFEQLAAEELQTALKKGYLQSAFPNLPAEKTWCTMLDDDARQQEAGGTTIATYSLDETAARDTWGAWWHQGELLLCKWIRQNGRDYFSFAGGLSNLLEFKIEDAVWCGAWISTVRADLLIDIID